MRTESVSFLMLFCALILVRKERATLQQSLQAVPLFGKAKELAAELIR